MVLRRWSVVLAASALAAVVRCASPGGTPPPSGAAPAPLGSPVASATPEPTLSGIEAEAALAELEDRRGFDEAVFSGTAKSPEPATRARAALAIGRIGDERGVPMLQGLLSDARPEVRAAAAFAAGLLPVPEAGWTAELRSLLADPDPAVAAAAAKALGFAGRPDGEDALIEALSRPPPPELRAAILQSLWKFANRASEAAALSFAGDSEPRVRGAAIYALSRKPQPGSVAALTAALRDENPDTAAFAARGLGVLGRAESLESLAAALDGPTPLRINALVALEAVLAKSPGATLSDDARMRVLALSTDANPNVAVAALALLRHFATSDREVSRRLWSSALSGTGRRREVALASLVAAFRGGAGTALDAAAASPDPHLRAAAAGAVSSFVGPDARVRRERFAGDPEVVVRLANLVGLKTPDAVRENRAVVNSALTDPDPGVRAAAVDALALLEDASVLPLLAEAVERSRGEASPDVAISVLGACETLKADPAAAALVEQIYRQGRTLPARLARRSLLTVFGRARAALPAPEYSTGKSRADYAAILAEAKRPWRARIETAAGAFTIRLAGDAAPLTAMNFVTLARRRYFDGVEIHRVVPNFVLQDGDPTATGNGGPGYEIRDEINALEYGRGTVGMALSGPDTGGSQWFVTHSPQPHLNGLYTIFGQVVEGQSAVERIGQGEKILRVVLSDGS